MAKSPAHKFGQIIGDTLEAAIEPLLHTIALQHGLFLDKKGKRPARNGRKVSWKDMYGNHHDLDYVLERDGTPQRIGSPVAFIETAWRRYTKHSRNKAQEIQGAVGPLLETYRDSSPFAGAILAGVFTEGALSQLRSLGFTVLYFPYETVVKAFRRVSIDVRFDEDTPDGEVTRKVRSWEELPGAERAKVAHSLIEINSEAVDGFLQSLKLSITRRITLVRVLPLHGAAAELASIEQAIAFIENYDQGAGPISFVRYEVEVRFSNGDRITGEFADKDSAIRFLRPFLATSHRIQPVK